VRDSRDEVRLQLLEYAILGQVPEGVDRSVHEADAGDREPELAVADLERDGLGADGGAVDLGHDRHPRRDRRPPGHRLDGCAADDLLGP
jgi:hypothetical protein